MNSRGSGFTAYLDHTHRMNWYGHVQRQDGRHCIKHIFEADVHGCQSQGRQRKRWINTISQDLITLNVTPMDAEDWDEWRRKNVCG